MPYNLQEFDNKTTESLQILTMKPKRSPQHSRQEDLFCSELCQIIDLGHPLVKLNGTVDWNRLDELFGATYSPDQGRPAISTRLMVSLHYLKYMHNLSDEDVLSGWSRIPTGSTSAA
jgi:IS5 family transposase